MPNYDPMYKKLFNSITDAISVLEEQVEKLKQAQIDTEEMFMNSEAANLRVLPPGDEAEGERKG